MEKVKHIHVNHPKHGEIKIRTSIPSDINEMIGDVVSDYSKSPQLYHADVVENQDGTFDIKELKVIKPDKVGTGWMSNKKGNKNFITVIKNMPAGDDTTIYHAGVISVNYIKD
jgi:hypothetical protein